MNFDSIKKFIIKNKKIFIGLGMIPIAFFAYKSVNKAIKKSKFAPKKTPEPAWEIESLEKIMDIKEVRTKIGEMNKENFHIHFGRGKKQGCWGYYVYANKKNWVYICCSDEFEKALGHTSYWIELNEGATEAFKNNGMKKTHDIYTHPSIPGRIVISVMKEEIKTPEKTAEIVLEIVRNIR